MHTQEQCKKPTNTNGEQHHGVFEFYQKILNAEKIENRLEDKNISWVMIGKPTKNLIIYLLDKIHESSDLSVVMNCEKTATDWASDIDKEYPDLSEKLKLIIENEDDLRLTAKIVAHGVDLKLHDGWLPLMATDDSQDELRKIKDFFSYLGEFVNTKKVAEATIAHLYPISLENSLVNAAFLKENTLDSLKEKLDLKKPFLIVSAGPSLNKQLDVLSRNHKKFNIICASTVCGLLSQKGISPDVILGLDPETYVTWSDLPESNIVLDVQVDPATVFSSRENCYVVAHNELFKNFVKTYTDTDIDVIESGGSIATSAYALAKRLGAAVIVFIGQDLAYTTGKLHADGYVGQTEEEDKNTIDNRATFEVPGFNGEAVLTDGAFLMFKTWFESQFKLDKQIVVINSTEGGLLLDGAANVEFQVVCNEVEKFNFIKSTREKGLKSTISHALDIKHLKKIKTKFLAFSKRMTDLIRLCERGLGLMNKNDDAENFDFEKLEKLNSKISKSCKPENLMLHAYSHRHMLNIQRKVVRVDQEDDALDHSMTLYKEIFEATLASAKHSRDYVASVIGYYEMLINNDGNLDEASGITNKLKEFSRLKNT